MVFRNSVGSFLLGNPTKVFERRRSLIKKGFPSRSIEVQYSDVCLNSKTFLDSLPEYDSDKLEKDVEVGLPLDRVSTLCMSPQSIDPLDLQEVVDKFEKKQIFNN